MGFRQLKKGSCPICNGISRGPRRGGGDCRENTITGVVHCRTGLELDRLPPGWKFIRENRIGFGMFAQEIEDPALGQQRWEEVRQRQEAERQRRLAQQRASLSLDERDTQFRELLAQGGLFLADREDLQRRGLDDMAIARGRFITIQPGIHFHGIDPRFPGIAGGMRQYLRVKGDGYLCPAWDVGGRVIGAQIRLRNSDEGKYRWLKSGHSSHLPSGELPITVCRPPLNSPNKPQDIGLIEGILKPWVASQLSGRIFIGASGGNFRSSPEQLHKTLTALSQEIKRRLQVTLFPDANGVGNPQVYARDCETIKLIRSWGYRVRVADWGQLFDKSQPDYDEMLANGSDAQIIRYIPADQYLKLRPDPIKLKRKEAAKKMQRKLEDITPYVTETRHECYLNIDPADIPENSICAVKSAAGTGKTEYLKRLYSVSDDATVGSYRNGLLMNTAERLKEVGDIGYLWDLQTDDYRCTDALWKNYPWVLACLDSIAKLSVRDTFILEEADKVFSHVLYGQTCQRDRPAILALLEKHIKGAKRVILLDADLTGIALRYVRALDPSKDFNCVHNTFKTSSWKVYSHQGALDDKGIGKKSCRRPLEAQIIDAVQSGLKPLIVSDSQKWLEAFCNLLSELFPQKTHLRVDSRTKADEAEIVDEFLSKPNDWLGSNQPDWVVISPTAESSLDITAPYFDLVFGYFSGVIPHWSCQQMLARYRRPVDRIIFCKESGLRREGESDSFFPNGVAKDLLRKHLATVEKIVLRQYLGDEYDGTEDNNTLLKALSNALDPSTGEWNNPHLRAYCEYKARENYSLAYIREELEESLAKAGHEIIPVIEPDVETGGKEACDRVLQARGEAMVSAEDISFLEAQEIMRNMSATSQQRFAVQKALLRERVPGVDLTADFIYQYFLKDRNKLSRLQCLWMTNNPEVQYQIDREKWRSSLMYGTKLWDIRTYSLTVAVLSDLGVLDFLDRNEEWSTNSPEVIAFKERAISMSARLKLALNIKATPNSDPCYLLRRCLEKVGVTLHSQQRWIGDGQRARFYSIVPLTDEEQGILEAYDRRFAPYLLASQTAPLEDISRVQPVMPADSLPIEESPPGSPAGGASSRLVSILQMLEQRCVETFDQAWELWKEGEQLIAGGAASPFPGFWDRMAVAMPSF